MFSREYEVIEDGVAGDGARRHPDGDAIPHAQTRAMFTAKF
jgi:hypothetical protein